MRQLRRASLSLEHLEDRTCPVIRLSYTASLLRISGTPTGDVLITGQGGNAFSVMDGSINFGTYNVLGDVVVQLVNRPGTLEIDLNGSTIPGNVTLDLGNGVVGAPVDDTVDVFDSSAGGVPGPNSIRGSVFVRNGNGREDVFIGRQSDGVTPVSRQVDVRGSVYFLGRVSGLAPGDFFELGGGSRIRGNLVTSQIDGVGVGVQDDPDAAVEGRVDGNVTVVATGVTPGFSTTIAALVGHNVTVAGVASTQNFNQFTLEPVGTGVDSYVGGSLTVTLGLAPLGNLFRIQNGTLAVSRVQGNVTFTSLASGLGAAFDDFLVEGQVIGSFAANMNLGDNNLLLESGSFIGGNVVVSGGTGDDTVNYRGDVQGFISTFLGNGDNTVTFDGTAGATVGGVFRYLAGSGANTVTVDGGPGLPGLTVDIRLGSGDDVVTFDNGTFDGLLDFGAGLDTDIFLQGPNAILAPTFILINQ